MWGSGVFFMRSQSSSPLPRPGVQIADENDERSVVEWETNRYGVKANFRHWHDSRFCSPGSAGPPGYAQRLWVRCREDSGLKDPSTRKGATETT